jgi:DNA segregation ATPase FtsK/SpoIIIE-like protein
MYPHKQQMDLPELRRQLEELLEMVTTDLKIKCENQNQQVHIAQIRAIYNELPESDAPICPESNEDNEKVCDREPLYADALVVITEFGHASAAILQMWLSIDYGRAIKILDQFQADGLISSKGRVRHKAFVLRHSLAT